MANELFLYMPHRVCHASCAERVSATASGTGEYFASVVRQPSLFHRVQGRLDGAHALPARSANTLCQHYNFFLLFYWELQLRRQCCHI